MEIWISICHCLDALIICWHALLLPKKEMVINQIRDELLDRGEEVKYNAIRIDFAVGGVLGINRHPSP